MRVATQPQPAAIDASSFQPVDLLHQHRRIDNNAVPDDRYDPVVEDSAGNELQSERLTVDDKGMARVVTTLVTDHEFHLAGQEVSQLSLARVAPLVPDD